ncbi:hypothetical protein AB0O65_01440 [Microbacterium sp. NPDC077391]|uniref:hypothetical protein n=1 Tax=Microbacterium sp. NPDC077391 TaxID=3154765 RepID=UPI00342E58BE
MTRSRTLPVVATLAAVALLSTGCATRPGSDAPTSSRAPSGASSAPVADGVSEVEVAWIDGGRAVALLTWGSSSCEPTVDDVSAAKQGIRVILAASGEKACTDDLAPRALMVPVPEGVDVTSDVEVEVVHGQRTDIADLEALAETPQGQTDFQPTASWYDDGGLVLLTWGSSSCRPVVDDVQATDAGATVTFQDIDRPCTMDMAPRLTPLSVPGDRSDGPYELTLVGGGLDGAVAVEG